MSEPARIELPSVTTSAVGPGASAPTARLFGWRIVLLGLIGNALGTGLIGIYAFMVSPLIDEFGATPGQLGLGMSIAIFSLAALSPVLGPLFDRGPLRAIMMAGVGVMFAGMLLLSRGTALWQLGVCMAIAAAGVSMFGMLPAKVMIVNWFVRRRGTALAMAATGTSLAGFSMPLLVAWLIEVASWRAALVWLGAGAAAIALPAIVLLAVRRPEDVGLHPDGAAGPESRSEDQSIDVSESGPRREPAAGVLSTREITRNRNFWMIGLGEALAMCVPVATGVFFVRHLEELGIARTDIALVMPVMAVCSLLGKLSVGALADRFDGRLLAVATLLLHVLGLGIVATGSGLGSMFAAAFPLGFGGGGFFPLPSILQGACFGRLVIGRVSGLHAFISLPFVLTSAPLTGLLAASTGSFVVPFLVLAGIQLLAAGVLAFVRIPAREPGLRTTTI